MVLTNPYSIILLLKCRACFVVSAGYVNSKIRACKTFLSGDLQALSTALTVLLRFMDRPGLFADFFFLCVFSSFISFLDSAQKVELSANSNCWSYDLYLWCDFLTIHAASHDVKTSTLYPIMYSLCDPTFLPACWPIYLFGNQLRLSFCLLDVCIHLSLGVFSPTEGGALIFIHFL